MFKPTLTMAERFNPSRPVAADASSATSLRFGAKPRRRRVTIGASIGIVVVFCKRVLAALHETQMRQAAREMHRYRDLIADDETAIRFALEHSNRAARNVAPDTSQSRNSNAAFGGVANDITERE